MKHLKSALAGAALGLAVLGVTAAGTAVAAPMLLTAGSNVIGISDLDVGGTSYDVTFADADTLSYDDAVAIHGGTGHVFADSTEAAVAETALVNFLNSESVSSVLSTDSELIAFRVGPIAPLLDVFFVNYSSGSNAWIDNPFLSTGFVTFAPISDSAWAFFDANSTAVPAPGALLILGIGLAGIAFSRTRGRSRQRQTLPLRTPPHSS